MKSKVLKHVKALSVHKLNHYRSRALLKRLKLKPDQLAVNRQIAGRGEFEAILIDFPTRIFSEALKKFLFAKFFTAKTQNLCFTSIMLQFFYTKNEEKKKFTSLLFYIRPEQKATVS
jgi:hypothetical protein